MLLSVPPLASILTLAARTAHLLSEGLFRSRPTIFRRAPEDQDHPSWPAGAFPA